MGIFTRSSPQEGAWPKCAVSGAGRQTAPVSVCVIISTVVVCYRRGEMKILKQLYPRVCPLGAISVPFSSLNFKHLKPEHALLCCFI